MFSQDADADLRGLADDASFPHRDAARHAVRFRGTGDVAALLAVLDDPHPCAVTEMLFALACAQRPWLNWVPMPTEALCNVANEVGRRRAEGEEMTLTGLAVTAAEPPSATVACRRVAGPVEITVSDFPSPDIRIPVRSGSYRVWRYDGVRPVPAVPAPSAEAVRVLREVGGEPWGSPLSGYLQAEPLGKLPLDDLLGLLAHLPAPPETPRWAHLARSTPTYWYRLYQPWVCLALLRHGAEGREALTDLTFGPEDWVSDAALFALVTTAYREPARRAFVHEVVRARLDAALAAPRLVTIEESLAQLMLITPGCTTADRALATAVLARPDDGAGPPAPAPERGPARRRWWPRFRR
ncbi:hypothetical protein GCM10010172_83320 [Paractinoplanes ferrugineus]|uniref:Uncharacterized protein n=1 Tax=Paractinoplanes ferrugineus TaxID=113564 RepID=A0A919MCD9_9ACTN|nr:hypothetical protein [Actinoplanes ferrugineus]GIE10653.1 hypothetical protein Afe05nite_24930 [Actinoplanes ferrugineus]